MENQLTQHEIYIAVMQKIQTEKNINTLRNILIECIENTRDLKIIEDVHTFWIAE
jgi:hypothetical protein